MLGVGLWGGAKGNSHMGKGHRAGGGGASVYFGHMSSLLRTVSFFTYDLEVQQHVHKNGNLDNSCIFLLYGLILTTLWANSADDQLMIFFPRK